MKYFLKIILLFPLFIYSQSKIDGFVKDEKGEPLFGVSIYVDGSTIGTNSDENGYFSLIIPSESNSILVIRTIGFRSEFYQINTITKQLNVFLKEEVKELKEVVVEQNFFSRKQMLKLFKEQFLGTNIAAKNCTILNEEEIYFDYDRSTFKLVAYSDTPLIIKNDYLGYQISYQLVDFQCKFSKFSMNSEFVTQFQYAGNSLFTEIDSSSKINKRRQKSYNGSTLHFFRNLIANKWGKDDFVLFEGSFVTNPQFHFKSTKLDNGMYKIEVLPKKSVGLINKRVNQFNILYDNYEQSKIQFFISEFYVDTFGVFTNYESIIFSGAIVSKRVGDLLPTNFLK
jgi:hypothetical protein